MINKQNCKQPYRYMFRLSASYRHQQKNITIRDLTNPLPNFHVVHKVLLWVFCVLHIELRIWVYIEKTICTLFILKKQYPVIIQSFLLNGHIYSRHSYGFFNKILVTGVSVHMFFDIFLLIVYHQFIHYW